MRQVQLVAQVLDPRQLAARWLDEAVITFGATGGAVYLENGRGEELVHTSGEWTGEARLKLALEQDGTRVGSIALGPRRSGADYLPQDQAELQSSAGAMTQALARLRLLDGAAP